MHKLKFFFTIFLIIASVTIGCRSHSYGSSQPLSQSDSKAQLVIEDEDCFAWKFYLFTSMHSVVRQGAIRTVNNIKKRYLNGVGIDGPPVIDMNHVLPPKTAQKVMDAIIEKEGGHCSKEVLYEITPCAYEHVHREGYQRIGGFVYAGSAYTKIDFDHFSESLGTPISKDLLVKYEKFLHEHASSSLLNEHYEEASMVCEDHCNNDVFSLYYKNGLGRCMLEKYRTYFKENGIFDFGEFFYWERYDHNPELHMPSMEAYIKETNRISEKYKKNKTKP